MKQSWFIIKWDIKNKLQWNSKQNAISVSEENAFGNVCKMPIIQLGDVVVLLTTPLSHSMWISGASAL